MSGDTSGRVGQTADGYAMPATEAVVAGAMRRVAGQRVERFVGFAADVGGIGGVLVAEHGRVGGGDVGGQRGDPAISD